jgi:hypothetical protein
MVERPHELDSVTPKMEAIESSETPAQTFSIHCQNPRHNNRHKFLQYLAKHIHPMC